jgi:DNA-damage-inducible protein J
MAQTTFSVRMDSNVKKNLDDFCSQVGMNTSTAFNLEVDPYYNESNLAHLRRGVAALNKGEGIERDIIEVNG